MAEGIHHDHWLCWDKYDVSNVSSNLQAKITQELKEKVCFKPIGGVTADKIYKSRFIGAESAEIAVAGYLDVALNFAAEQAVHGSAAGIATFGWGRTLGDDALLLESATGNPEMGGQVGELVPFSATISNNGANVLGKVFEFGSKTATGNGTSRVLGAVTAVQSLYLHIHAVSVTGTNPTLDVIYETSANGTYADAVTRATFAQLTAAGKERIVLAGPITDTNHRFRIVIGGTDTPTFIVRFVAGIR